MRRLAAAAVALLCVLAIGGCAMIAESRLDEYRATGKELAMHVVGLIPEELEPLLDAELWSEGQAPRTA